jgi:hypothetical protein
MSINKLRFGPGFRDNIMPRNAKAVMIEPRDDDRLEVGECYFVYGEGNDPTGVIHACPCGCGGRSLLRLTGPQAWTAVGEWPNVTLSPSIGIKYDVNGNRGAGGGHHWHGFLENGVFVER